MSRRGEEEVIAAAAQVFKRYGYKRVTMGDIALAAHMSRPALYLVFPSKEGIFTALVAQVFKAMLSEIREGLDRFATTEEKLRFVFDVWCVRGFEMIQASPDAKDLYESSYQFATEVTTKAASDFVGILAEVLDPLVQKQAQVSLSSHQIGQLLANAVPGFKTAVKTTEQLREMIGGLIAVVLASLGSGTVVKYGKKAARK